MLYFWRVLLLLPIFLSVSFQYLQRLEQEQPTADQIHEKSSESKLSDEHLIDDSKIRGNLSNEEINKRSNFDPDTHSKCLTYFHSLIDHQIQPQYQHPDTFPQYNLDDKLNYPSFGFNDLNQAHPKPETADILNPFLQPVPEHPINSGPSGHPPTNVYPSPGTYPSMGGSHSTKTSKYDPEFLKFMQSYYQSIMAKKMNSTNRSAKVDSKKQDQIKNYRTGIFDGDHELVAQVKDYERVNIKNHKLMNNSSPSEYYYKPAAISHTKDHRLQPSKKIENTGIFENGHELVGEFKDFILDHSELEKKIENTGIFENGHELVGEFKDFILDHPETDKKSNSTTKPPADEDSDSSSKYFQQIFDQLYDFIATFL